MRLPRVETGHRFVYRWFLRLIAVVLRRDAPDVMKAVCYRPELYGYPYTRLLQPVIRGRSDWTIGERELFGAFTASLNRCPF